MSIPHHTPATPDLSLTAPREGALAMRDATQPAEVCWACQEEQRPGHPDLLPRPVFCDGCREQARTLRGLAIVEIASERMLDLAGNWTAQKVEARLFANGAEARSWWHGSRAHAAGIPDHAVSLVEVSR